MRKLNYWWFFLAYAVCPFLYVAVLGIWGAVQSPETIVLRNVGPLFFIGLIGLVLLLVPIIALSGIAFYFYRKLTFSIFLVIMNCITFFTFLLLFAIITENNIVFYGYSMVVGIPAIILQNFVLWLLIYMRNR
ncbi:MAG: hypothetical protein Q4G54_03535 [Pelistega sp.]|nr:hypothetical protein [Pelistega sp.]